MDIVKLKPVIKDNLWGGNYFKQYKEEILRTYKFDERGF